MDRTRLARHLVRSALAYYEAALWRRFHSNQITAVHVPGQPAPVFVSIVGRSGDHGLCLFRGEGALRAIQGLTAGGDPAEVMSPADTLMLMFEPLSHVPEQFQGLLREAKFSGHPAPWFLSHPPGRQHRPTNRSENELLLSVLEGLLASDARALLRPMEVKARGKFTLWTLRLSGPPTAPEVRAKFEEYAPVSPAPEPVVMPADVDHMPKTTASWWIAAPLMPAGIENDDRELHALLIFDATANRILRMDVVFSVEPDAVADALFAVCRGSDGAGPRGLPAHVDFDRRALHDALGPVLAEVGVSTAYVPELPQAKAIVEEFMAHQASGESRDDAPAPDDQDAEPAADDLDAWKRIDAKVSELLATLVEAGDEKAKKAAERYFGPRAEMLDDDSGFAIACFAEWYACHWRGSARSRTAAERLLAEGLLSPGLQCMLASRAEAKVGFYRVAAVIPGEGVELVDVLQGSSVRVRDRALSGSAQEGLLLFAKVYPAGAFTFLAGLSAPLLPTSETVLQWLESQGLKLTPAGLQASAHVLGRLWSLRAQQDDARPQLKNSDGEELLDVRASFAVADERTLRDALLRRDDVEAEEDQPDGVLVWFRENGDGSRLLLGRLEFVGGELVASVNSEPRLLRLQAWLGKMQGVRQIGVTRQEFTKPPADDQLRDSAPPAPPSAEMLEDLRKYMREHCRRWLDESIPALDGRTPRQAVKTAAGRRKVARMIRTMPDPLGPAGLIRGLVPREEMLRELGLEAEGERESSA